MLLERQPALDALSTLREQAAAGRGQVALLGGEAGIGKTTLLREFARDAVWGACDPLFTPRSSTREQPFGLTTRELQILRLLCDGLRNAEIGFDSRLAAIQAAQRAGLAVPSGQAPAPRPTQQ